MTAVCTVLKLPPFPCPVASLPFHPSSSQDCWQPQEVFVLCRGSLSGTAASWNSSWKARAPQDPGTCPTCLDPFPQSSLTLSLSSISLSGVLEGSWPLWYILQSRYLIAVSGTISWHGSNVLCLNPIVLLGEPGSLKASAPSSESSSTHFLGHYVPVQSYQDAVSCVAAQSHS